MIQFRRFPVAGRKICDLFIDIVTGAAKGGQFGIGIIKIELPFSGCQLRRFMERMAIEATSLCITMEPRPESRHVLLHYPMAGIALAVDSGRRKTFIIELRHDFVAFGAGDIGVMLIWFIFGLSGMKKNCNCYQRCQRDNIPDTFNPRNPPHIEFIGIGPDSFTELRHSSPNERIAFHRLIGFSPPSERLVTEPYHKYGRPP
jgi:hypothetical protein